MHTEHAQIADQQQAFVIREFTDSRHSGLSQRHVANLLRHTDNLQPVEKIDHLSDAELLELLLAYATDSHQKRGNSQHLLQQFGDFGHVLAARATILRDKGKLTEAQVLVLKLFALSAQRMARARLREMPVLSGSQALLDYCHTTLGHRESEQFRVLFLDRKNRLIADEVLGEGTVDHVPVYPREVIRRALELNACALILVHNHPSGDPTPSDADIAMTHAIQLVAQALSITVHDHLIIGKSSETSLRAEGLLSA